VRGDAFMANRAALTIPPGNNNNEIGVIVVAENDV